MRAERDLAQANERLQTHAKELERAVEERTLELRETIAELETFSSSLSHDLRAPLRGMGGFAQAMLEDFGERVGPEGEQMLAQIVHSSRRLSRFVENVLGYTRLSRRQLKFEAVPLAKVVPTVIEDYPHAREANAEVQIEQPLLPVMGNESLLTQVIANLVSNAVKFIPPNTRPKVRIWTEKRNGNVRLWVEDNGIGIAAGDQAKIFGLFTRLEHARAYEGTGIGLAVVHRAMKKMGGDAGVESKPGQGSRFWGGIEGHLSLLRESQIPTGTLHPAFGVWRLGFGLGFAVRDLEFWFENCIISIVATGT